jgi:ribosomal protein S18 acetylase RimI-like enzyme
MLIRRLTTVDLAALQGFYDSLTEAITYFFRPWADPNEEVLREHLAAGAEGRAVVWGLLSDAGEVEGHAFIRWLESDRPSFGIALRERVQGQGWGRRLTEALLADADQRGVPEVYLGVNKDNPRAIALYQKLGWTTVGAIESNCPEGSWRMVRRRPAADPLIRPLTLADQAALGDFYGALPEAVTCFFQPWPEATPEVLQDHLAGAEAGHHVVLGLVAAESSGSGRPGSVEGHGFLWNVDTDKPVLGIGLRERAQGHGWGRALMQALLAAADARALPEVHLTVLKDNVRALPLYESLGFERVGETTFRTENDSLCMMRKRVS